MILTEKAAIEVKRIIAEMNEGEKFLKVAVRGGGCSGFQYALNLDDEHKPERELLHEQHGVKIAIDKISALYLDGVTIDFYEDVSKRGFVFDNPKPVGTCACGSHF